MDLVLVMQNASNAGLLWCGISGREMGKLQPNSAKVIDLSMIAISAGLQVTVATYAHGVLCWVD